MDYEIMMNGIVKIGQLAPDFEAISTNGKISLSDYKGKWVVLFSHPRRFYPRMYHRIYSLFQSKYIFSKPKHTANWVKYRQQSITSSMAI